MPCPPGIESFGQIEHIWVRTYVSPEPLHTVTVKRTPKQIQPLLRAKNLNTPRESSQSTMYRRVNLCNGIEGERKNIRSMIKPAHVPHG